MNRAIKGFILIITTCASAFSVSKSYVKIKEAKRRIKSMDNSLNRANQEKEEADNAKDDN